MAELQATREVLARAEEQLAPSLDDDEVMEAVAGLALPQLADWCVLHLLDESGTLMRVSMVHRDAAKQPLLEKLRQLPLSPAEWPWLARAVDARAAEVVREPHPRCAGGGAQELLDALGMGSILCVPLLARETVLGTLTWLSAETGYYRARDLPLAEMLGRRAATAIEHARLHRRARDELAERDELIAVAAHDLGNPLTALRAHTAVMLETTYGAERRRLQSVDRICRNVLDMVGDLLDTARLRAGQTQLTRAPQSVDALVREVVDRFSPMLREKERRIEAQLEPDLPPLWCDHGRMLRLLCNLVENAVKFTERGGTILMRAEKRDGAIWFAVTDDGVGIDKAELPHVFTRYWHGAQRSDGAGLGLHIAKEIVAAHDGAIGVESTPGHGTQVFFIIPAA